MKRLMLILAVATATIAFSALSTGTQAGMVPPSPDPLWTPLLSCPDTDGSGRVDLPNDILGVALRWQTVWDGPPNPDSGMSYSLIYDTSGGNKIDLPNDILGTIIRWQEECPLVDQQVAQATQAIMPYEDPAVAIADGYVQSTQDVSNMGIHMYNLGFQTAYPDFASQMLHPVGLVYTDANPDPNIDVPDKLIGAWYNVAIPEVCEFFGVPNPENCPTSQPEGFDGDGDLTVDTTAIQQAWHTHTGLCYGGVGTAQAWVVETFSTETQDECESAAYGPCPCFYFATYGWMMHLYNFIPNPFDSYPAGYPTEGRFTRWNQNVPYTD